MASPAAPQDEAILVAICRMVIQAPILETLLFQSLIIESAILLSWSIQRQISIAALIFAGCHLVGGMAAMLAGGPSAGLVFSATYAVLREVSYEKAPLAGTIAIHAAWNLGIVLLL